MGCVAIMGCVDVMGCVALLFKPFELFIWGHNMLIIEWLCKSKDKCSGRGGGGSAPPVLDAAFRKL